MEKLKHTPEPWTCRKSFDVKYNQRIFSIDSDQYEEVVTVWSCEPEGENIVSSEATANRIVDCVNAMTGIENPSEFIENLKQKNLELLQLLESIEVMLSQGNSITPKSFIIRNAIQMALGIENKESINEKLKTK